ncbi:LysR substrate-binding domain-containing protein [Rhizobium sp. P44RR-XXIV]|uniref:LysR substrate-binding domain-containing protein n=1 Tax=Rhizobium sp. P44RR-XXIV TaxID=1921145 RepID=UPI0009844A06|nr:LysR substrate-binding domain-containing protein [Rhizobium sp. P44RR-XXIV]TIX90519.1 LysR family transcriptional regulator [Rhizobium sp. P44RR-XXIV]
MSSQIDDLVGLRRGHVCIAIIDALAKGFIATVVRNVRREFPGITIELKVLNNVDVQGVVQRGEVDFGLMLAPQTSKDIIVQNHRDIVLGVITQPDHQLASMPGIRFSRCVEYPIVAPAEPLALCDQVNALQAATGIVLSPAISSDNIQMIKSLVIDGAGVGILTSLDVIEEVRLGELAFVPLEDGILRPIPLALCVGQARQLSHAARLLLDRVEQALLQRAFPAA